MRRFSRFLFFIVCANLASCTLPDQVDQAVANDPPVVTLTVDRTTLQVGDTLRLALHVADPTLKSGMVDFKDGNVVGWENLNRVLDTTLLHCFKSVGSYDITGVFTDGNKKTTERLGVQVSHSSPTVTIVPNRTALSIGDTLKVSIHAADVTLSDGNVAFGDGTMITFSNLSRVVDTTVDHVYSYQGAYVVTATFSNGYNSRSASFSIAPSGHYFSLSLSVGMMWRFSYRFSSDVPPSAVSDSQGGTHVWWTISSVVLGQDTSFTVQQIRNDTRHLLFPSNNQYVDTTYNISDTLEFPILVSHGYIQFNWPLHYGMRTDTVPNHAFVPRYPYYATQIGGGATATYDDKVGPLEYSYDFSTIHSISSSEHMTLVAFTKP